MIGAMDVQSRWSQWRGVLFLDPFATQVKWSTIERIAGFNALDTWILVSSVRNCTDAPEINETGRHPPRMGR